ncbi:unnamed protein product [Calicophoron daubneyi]|uniref:Protein-tyrosine sulfotransferase n=1 Tax=Calicophoron daubneyi TaxID=300641 RepID=A0AAV2TKN4_CALDB
MAWVFVGYKRLLLPLRILSTICILMYASHLLVKRRAFGTVHRCHQRTPDEKALVFIGGHPRSGTTLLRVLLDVHPQIRCGPESRIIPHMLSQLNSFQSGYVNHQLKAARVYPQAVHAAFSAFIATLVEEAGEPAQTLCSKDPMTFEFLRLLGGLFPKAKFIHVVRDGRAVTASMLKRRITTGDGIRSARFVFWRWEKITFSMVQQCSELGPLGCFQVRYEDIVLRPHATMRKILGFLGVPWDPVVLRHETKLAEGTVFSDLERSTSQVKYPIHTKAVDAWARSNSVLSKKFIQTAHLNSSLLKKLGYASAGIPPNYGEVEPKVLQTTARLSKNPDFLELFS